MLRQNIEYISVIRLLYNVGRSCEKSNKSTVTKENKSKDNINLHKYNKKKLWGRISKYNKKKINWLLYEQYLRYIIFLCLDFFFPLSSNRLLQTLTMSNTVGVL